MRDYHPAMQDSLFDDATVSAGEPSKRRATRNATVEAAPVDPAHRQLADVLPAQLRLGTSSWYFPGWNGLVWDGDYPEARLSRHGLPAYAAHPLLRTVSVDRGFYQPLSVAQYAAYAAQVPAGFRFVIKAPGRVTDALVRDEEGRGLQANPLFLDPQPALHDFVEPALAGLGHRLGALVFQLSPLPATRLQRPAAIVDALHRLLAALPDLSKDARDAVVAVELRDPALLANDIRPRLVEVLRACGATYCLGLHAKMPPIDAQLPVLRALWPGPLVCRWNLHRRHGAYGYEDAKRLYGDFAHLVDPDPETRATLARVITATAAAGHPVYVTIGNKAEGSAPRSVAALAEAVAAAGATASR